MSTERGVSMQRLPVAGRWAIYLALAVGFAIACAYLANWQFSRNEERSSQLALVDANYDAEPVSLDELIPTGSALDPADEWRQVRLVGEYLADDQLVVRNRPHGGTSAFEVLVPLRLDDGRVVLVNRGWVRPGENSEPEAIPAAPDGEVTVTVRLRPGEARPASGRSAPAGQVPTINLDLIADELDAGAAAALERSAYGIRVSEVPSPAEAPNALEAPSDDPGPHLSYAIQWILFAVMGFIFIGYVIRTERAHRREEAADENGDETADDEETRDAAPAPPASRPARRRRDRDAEDEDALLDAAGR